MNPNIRIVGFADFSGTHLCERVVADGTLIQTGQPDAVRQVVWILFLQLL